MTRCLSIFTFAPPPAAETSPAAANGPPPVFFYDEGRAGWSLRLRHGKWAGQEWTVTLLCCANPLCSCRALTLDCQRIGDAAAPPLRCNLYPIAKTAAPDATTESRGDAAELVRDLVAEFGTADWRRVQQAFISGKRGLLRDLDVTTLPAESLPKTLPTDTTMALYTDAFPFAPDFEFGCRDERWTGRDQYCVSPDCDCHEVVLAFLPLTAPPDASGNIPSHCISLARYDYVSGNLETIHPPAPDQPTLPQLLDALRAANPEFHQEVRKRHRQLKVVYAHALPLPPPEDVALDTPFVNTEPQVGRNDPCPCGSGKKYKKCCGRFGGSAGAGGSGLSETPPSPS